MVMNRMDGVGKKIVDALKAQSEVEIQNVVESQVEMETPEEHAEEPQFEETNTYQNVMTFNQTPSMLSNDSFANELEGFDIPTNVAVLKQLISQLPAGVSKQTGAIIIKQTMEALGISMKSVLQEAQQVQESLNNSSRECQTSIMEYKKQIGVLERQSQKFQKQYAALNDIISLFIQTNI